MILYRLVSAAHADLSGEGARLFPGRWNTKDIPCIYTSSSASLAQLEVMVNAEDWTIFIRRNYVLLTLEVNSSKLRQIETSELPAGWNLPVVTEETQQFGTRQLEDRSHTGFIVPSVVTPKEKNIILNPLSDRFGQLVKITSREPFKLDARLLENRKR
jgi:RES domain-containing protein